MKKKLTILLILLAGLLIVSLVLGQQNQTENISQKFNQVGGALQNASGAIQPEIFDIKIPSWLQPITKIMFGFQETVSIGALAIALSIFLFFLFSFDEMLQLSSFNDVARWGISFFMSIVLALLGLIKAISSGFFLVFEKITNLSNLGVFASILLILILGIILVSIKFFVERIKAHKRLESSKHHLRQVKY